ncbi:hypothetical protein RD792_002747 [Penstemon davidsonii]|uniref:Sulfite exporter TauE/SafE family protein n=1 Tax=Penstemon davidsonii TaxID=160366 RepID=A0ABR0DSV1_9LAMI|nr:hypothetical protein RD792_002747 [Penstemon davidsonii]
MKQKSLKYLFLLIISTNFHISQSKSEPPISQILNFNPTPNTTQQYWENNVQSFTASLKSSIQFLLPGVLSFIAAAISSAGGVGGGGLFIPILAIVANLQLRTASSYSAFMVTGGSIANVACHMLLRRGGEKQLIDFDIALLSEPFMLLGTCKSGVLFWKLESETEEACDGGSTKEPLLREELDEGKMWIPWMKIGMLVVIWFSFFLFNLLRGNRYGQGVIKIKPCGTGYWIISSIQIPLAIIFTTWILYIRKNPNNNDSTHQLENIGPSRSSYSSHNLIFPIMALSAGVLGGVFGIGGVQYLLLGMDHLSGALTYASICFVGSLVGLTLVQQAIMKHGRASLIVFSVGTVMALSTVLITSFGAVTVWSDYTSGKSMGFKRPC